MTSITYQPARLLRLPTVTERVGLKRTAIYDMIRAGKFPKPVPLNDKSVGWLESEINEWIAERVAVRDEEIAQSDA